MKKFLPILLLPFMLLSCSEDDPVDCCVNYDLGVGIKYENEAGENLFEGEDALKLSDITVYHKVKEEWEVYFKGNLDSPKGLSIHEVEGVVYLHVSASIETDAENISETKLEFPDGEEDILRTEIYKNRGNTNVRKVWFNGELKWDPQVDKGRRFISVVK